MNNFESKQVTLPESEAKRVETIQTDLRELRELDLELKTQISLQAKIKALGSALKTSRTEKDRLEELKSEKKATAEKESRKLQEQENTLENKKEEMTKLTQEMSEKHREIEKLKSRNLEIKNEEEEESQKRKTLERFASPIQADDLRHGDNLLVFNKAGKMTKLEVQQEGKDTYLKVINSGQEGVNKTSFRLQEIKPGQFIKQPQGPSWKKEVGKIGYVSNCVVLPSGELDPSRLHLNNEVLINTASGKQIMFRVTSDQDHKGKVFFKCTRSEDPSLPVGAEATINESLTKNRECTFTLTSTDGHEEKIKVGIGEIRVFQLPIIPGEEIKRKKERKEESDTNSANIKTGKQSLSALETRKESLNKEIEEIERRIRTEHQSEASIAKNEYKKALEDQKKILKTIEQQKEELAEARRKIDQTLEPDPFELEQEIERKKKAIEKSRESDPRIFEIAEILAGCEEIGEYVYNTLSTGIEGVDVLDQHYKSVSEYVDHYLHSSQLPFSQQGSVVNLMPKIIKSKSEEILKRSNVDDKESEAEADKEIQELRKQHLQETETSEKLAKPYIDLPKPFKDIVKDTLDDMRAVVEEYNLFDTLESGYQDEAAKIAYAILMIEEIERLKQLKEQAPRLSSDEKKIVEEELGPNIDKAILVGFMPRKEFYEGLILKIDTALRGFSNALKESGEDFGRYKDFISKIREYRK
ncbi:MAG: hypothetical protein GF347_01460 [Candidatus Moranbacteria bacterium]|nr:hypothetical protein [Candidatus Moranbacteria bacterium]